MTGIVHVGIDVGNICHSARADGYKNQESEQMLETLRYTKRPRRNVVLIKINGQPKRKPLTNADHVWAGSPKSSAALVSRDTGGFSFAISQALGQC